MSYLTPALMLFSLMGSDPTPRTDMVRVVGYIGAHRLELSAYEIASSRTFAVPGRPRYIGITEVYPDTPEPVVYRYTVTGEGICPYERRFRSVGFGRLTYFIKAGEVPVERVRITCRRVNGENRPVLISSVFGVSDAELERLAKQDRFPIMGLLPTASTEERDRLAGMLKKNIPSLPERGISVGFSSEIRYANQNAKQVEDEIRNCAELAGKHGLRAMLGPVSWWVGTPAFVEDGEGGRFGDVKYQQICYAPDREFPLDTKISDLLGARYNRHYKLSVPNRWSNTPWLTMNNSSLNEYRFRRLGECVRILKEVCGGDYRWISGVFLENEPRYWDTQCETHPGEPDPQTLWADFNPAAVEAAERDGVDLNPEDGLSHSELAWLHRNVGRYNQDTVNAFRSASEAHGLDSSLPLYTHSLQHRWMFPGAEINHAASEWAFAVGARTGLEGMFTMPSDFYRVREWGRWANLNREENDGRDIDLHLWDLRVSYAMGADLYNSYNWHAIGPERFFAYVREFMEELPVVSVSPASFEAVDKYTFRMKAPMKMQAFTKLSIPVKLESAVKGSACVTILLPDNDSFASECRFIDLDKGDYTLSFEFSTPAECMWQDQVQVNLYVFDRNGRMALDGVSIAAASPEDVKMELDLAAQRALSLAVIEKAAMPRPNP